MALINRESDFNNLIKLSPSGLQIANYPQVKRALENKFREVYGSDIDLSTGTADGVYVENICILINNILQTFKIIYSNLNVNEASGKYLDLLCALSNIYRKPATKSQCYLKVTLKEGQKASPRKLTFLDVNGYTWTWTNDLYNPLEFILNQKEQILVTCDVYGNIEALAGIEAKDDYIHTLISNDYIFDIKQDGNAIVGSAIESDHSLRYRRNQTLGNSGITVLDSLQNALLSHPSVKDVKIINNNTGADIPGDIYGDNTVIKNHNIYIILRKYNSRDTSSDNEIASLIQNKLTPGIITQVPASNVVGGKSVIKEFFLGDTSLRNTISWKEATSVNKSIEITVKALNYFSDDSLELVGKKIIDYINDLKIDEDLDLNNIIYYANLFDPKFKGQPTYSLVKAVFTDDSTSVYFNPLSYFKYNAIEITDNEDRTYTLKLSYKE